MRTTATERCPWCGSTITHAKFLQVEAAMKARIAKELAAAVEIEQKKLLKERQRLDADRSKMKQHFDKQLKTAVAEVRVILQKDREAALAKREAAFAREREALQKKVVEISRRVKKAGGEIAEGAELDLYDELRTAFPDDQLARTKGSVLQDIRYKGKSAGRILLDTKARGSWQQAFVTKLRQDLSETGADHAILATPVFPVGKRELFVDSGVIVVAPARVAAIVEVLRKALISMHVARLSDAERADKLGRLFKFITSPAFRKKFAEASELAGEALEIDVQEKRAHDLVWRKRGTVLTRIKNVLREIDTDVSAIVEARDEAEPDGAKLRAAAYRVTSR